MLKLIDTILPALRPGAALARVRHTSEHAINPDSHSPLAIAPRQCNVLVAEDEPDIRELLVLILELEGYVVTAVSNGQAAIEAILHTDFRLALLDVSMPILDGLATAAILKRACPRLRVVIHTAMDEDWVQKRFSGYDGYFRKPLDAQQLIGSIPRIL